MSVFCKKKFRSEYEREREANIRKNERILLKLGIDMRVKGKSYQSSELEESSDSSSDQDWRPEPSESVKNVKSVKKPTFQPPPVVYRPGMVEEAIAQEEKEEKERRKRKSQSTETNGKRSKRDNVGVPCDYTFGKCTNKRKVVDEVETDDFEDLKFVDLSLDEESGDFKKSSKSGECYEEFLKREEEVAEIEEDIALVGRHIRHEQLAERLEIQDSEGDKRIGRKESLAKDRNRRHLKQVDYTEEDLSDEDCFLFCEECNELYMGDCPVHGELKPLDESRIDISPLSIIPIPSPLSLKRSSIPGAGLGIFAKETIPIRTRMGPYAGKLIKGCVEDFPNESEYLWQIKRDHGKTIWYIDGEDLSKANWLRFVNCARNEDEQNLVSFQYRGRIYYRSYKPIRPGNELLVYYGDQYARQLGIQEVSGELGESEERCENGDGEVCVTTGTIRMRRFGSGDKPYKCEQCSCSYSHKYDLTAHTRIHTGKNLLKCEYCSKPFTCQQYLKRHIRTHTGEKPFECETCHRRFSQDINLITHRRIHTGEKPYECSTCHKRFSRDINLITHRRIHTGEKPYECSTCSKRFSDSSSLIAHRRIHTGEKPYECCICKRRFNQSSARNSHMKTHRK